jgi:hypothetical protein
MFNTPRPLFSTEEGRDAKLMFERSVYQPRGTAILLPRADS